MIKFSSSCIFRFFLFSIILFSCRNTEQNAPHGLMINLLSDTESAVITEPVPHFSWITGGEKNMQTAFQIIISTDKKGEESIWDSGKVESDKSVAVPYAGQSLKENSNYRWKVRSWNQNGKASAWSKPQTFNTGSFHDTERKWPGESKWVELERNGNTEFVYENRNPIRYHEIKPVSVETNSDNNQFIRFEKAAFGALKLTLDHVQNADTIIVHLGEDISGQNSVNQKPGGSIIYNRLEVTLQPGQTEYLIQIPRFISHYPNSQVLAGHMPEVTSFRYAEIERLKEKLTPAKIRQLALLYHFDDKAADFSCSNENLNQIWELCKHTLKVTPFMGVYIDGGARERMPYEADAFMQQVSHYCVDREFAIQRYTADFLIYNPSWPTEWHLHMALIAWADYMATGDARFLENRYDELKKKTLLALAREDGLISTRTGLVTPDFLKSIHYNGSGFRDIVDWPQGTPANETQLRSGHGSVSIAGETDRFVFTDINTVVNAFHYRNLILMAKIAAVLNKTEEVRFFEERASLVKSSFNEKLLSKETGIYTDGEDTEHSALHSNMFPVAFGLAPENYYPGIRDFLISRGMACSPGMSMYLFDALYETGADDYAFQLLTSESDRSWMNMIRFGTTVTSEAWDLKYKRNMTWNHAWSAIPAYVISRKVCGIEPIEPSFRKIRIKPHISGLQWAKIKHPTIRGNVEVEFEHDENVFSMKVIIPPNCTSDIYIPRNSKQSTVTQNGKPIEGEKSGNYLLITDVMPGKYLFVVKG